MAGGHSGTPFAPLREPQRKRLLVHADLSGAGLVSPGSQLVRSGSDAIADRLHVFYRLRVKKPGAVPKVVEQHLLCELDADRIDGLDLVCSGFRPDEAAESSTTRNRPQHRQYVAMMRWAPI